MFLTAPLCSVHLFLQGLLAPTIPTYWGESWQLPALWLQVTEYTTLLSSQVMIFLIGQDSPVEEQV